MYKSILRSLSSLIFATSAWAFDSSDAFNTITFSYLDQANVSQIINLSDAQRSTATSITLTVDAKDGGGRPTHNLDGTPAAYSTQYDVSRIRIHVFNSSGTSIGTMTTTTNLKNWGSSSNPGWSTGPGDNQHPWTTATVTLNANQITGGFAAVAYVRVYLISDEGSYWAGNYGVQYRTPTLQINGQGANLLYNPEFGVDSSGVKVQGWTPSYGAYASCGVTSGNSICTTLEPEVTANMWGGGEDPDGGTISGQEGGYASVLTADNADTAAEGGDIGGGSTTPAPTPVYSSGITQTQSSKRTSKLADTATHGMEAHINIDGNNNQVNIDQHNAAHYLELTIVGGSNTVDIDQNTTGSAIHYSDVIIQGDSNSLDLLQTGTGSKTAFIGIDGNSNVANITQRDSGQHYLQLDLIGDGHDATIIQEGAGNHEATVELTNGGGAWNFDLTQQGSVSKEYSLPHGMSDGSTTSGTCYVAAGCSLTITQTD